MRLLIVKDDNDTKINVYCKELQLLLNKKRLKDETLRFTLGSIDKKINFKVDILVIITKDIYKYCKMLEIYKDKNIPIYIVLSTIKSDIVAKSVNITHFVYYIDKGPKYLIQRLF